MSDIPCYPSGTKEFIRSGVVGGDYTALTPVFMAIMPYDVEPGDDDWYAAQWETGTGRAMVFYGGDEGVSELDEGRYVVWVKPVAPPEEPLLRSGLIRIT
ncbi:hypothetical protein ACIBCT_21110 [Streptosporangium sp. NPDC050855]|uniref:hypothetical protein n=1 Tax=Streptosporangium sp. NPDC050855 TaxID=3366194 RepID=UPI0037B77C1A